MEVSIANIAPLMAEFRLLEIYASCAVAIYFYDLVVCGSSEIVEWYKSKLWSIPEIVCCFLETFTTLAYCIITLIFLHFTPHTPLSCIVLISLQQGFFALSTTFHSFMLLILLRRFFPERPYLAISLFLFATMTSLFQLINTIGFGDIVVNKLDDNCYVMGEGGKLTGFFSVGFIMMMIYCWIIWAVIGISIYFRKQFYYTRYWRRILIDDGYMYLSLIALSQAINVVFVLDGKNYLRQYINSTPLLVLTSICARKLLINTKPLNNGEKGISSRSIPTNTQRPQSLGTFIDQFYLQEQQSRLREQMYQSQRLSYQPNYSRQSYQHERQSYQQEQEDSRQSYQHERQSYQQEQEDSRQSYQHERQSYQQQEQEYSRQSYPQQSQEYLIKIPSPTHSSFTASTKVNSMPPSLPPIIIHKNDSSIIEEDDDDSYTEEFHNEKRSTKGFGSFLLDYFNKITTSPTRSTMRDSEQYNSRMSKVSRLSNLNMNGTSHFSLDSSRLSPGIRKSQPILVDPNDIYYFTYSSDNDNEVYLFPAIQIPQENSFNNDIKKGNESLIPSIRHQSIAFTGKIIPDKNNDSKKIVRFSDVQSGLSKKKFNDEKYNSYQEDRKN